MEKDREERLELALRDCKDIIELYDLNKAADYWSKLSNTIDPNLVDMLYREGKKMVNDFGNDSGYKTAILCYYEALIMIKRQPDKMYNKIIDGIALDVNVMHQGMMP